MKHIAKKRSSVSLMMLTLFACVFLLTGCGSGYDADTNTVFVEEDGKIVTVDVEEFDANTYSEEELKTYIQENINSYNGETERIKQKKLSVKDNVAKLVLEFADQTAYEEFYGMELFTGTIAEAKQNGYAFDVEFAKISDGKPVICESDEILKSEEALKVVIVKANTTVEVDGEIVYVSAENIANFGTNSVSIQAGSHILDVATADTQNTQATEGTEHTELTETTENEGSVGEDELLLTTEETEEEVEFDFGDSEEETTTSQFSEVYTYIIYRQLLFFILYYVYIKRGQTNSEYYEVGEDTSLFSFICKICNFPILQEKQKIIIYKK